MSIEFYSSERFDNTQAERLFVGVSGIAHDYGEGPYPIIKPLFHAWAVKLEDSAEYRRIYPELSKVDLPEFLYALPYQSGIDPWITQSTVVPVRYRSFNKLPRLEKFDPEIHTVFKDRRVTSCYCGCGEPMTEPYTYFENEYQVVASDDPLIGLAGVDLNDIEAKKTIYLSLIHGATKKNREVFLTLYRDDYYRGRIVTVFEGFA